jgi:hypothetical protein
MRKLVSMKNKKNRKIGGKQTEKKRNKEKERK